MSRVLAFDFGASSGRAILGAYENGELSYQEVHRFENNPRDKDGHFRWDFEDLLANVRLGAQKAGPVDSLAFDTWGVDFGLLDAQGRLLEDLSTTGTSAPPAWWRRPSSPCPPGRSTGPPAPRF